MTTTTLTRSRLPMGIIDCGTTCRCENRPSIPWEHATNVGTMFRGREDALQDNWLHVPIGYHGRVNSVYVSNDSRCTARSSSSTSTMMARRCVGGRWTIRRPCGKVMSDPTNPRAGSAYRPTNMLDFESEVAFFVGGGRRTSTTRTTPREGLAAAGSAFWRDSTKQSRAPEAIAACSGLAAQREKFLLPAAAAGARSYG